jgi:hypothetical protein
MTVLSIGDAGARKRRKPSRAGDHSPSQLLPGAYMDRFQRLALVLRRQMGATGETKRMPTAILGIALKIQCAVKIARNN